MIPEQTGLFDTDIETLTGILALTVMVIVLEVAGFPCGQAMFEVSVQVTTSPLNGVYV